MDDTFDKGTELCLQNAELWLREADLLYDNGSYGHACALYIHGLEGLIHSYFTWSVKIGSITPNNRDFLKSFDDHKTKLRSFYGILMGRMLFHASRNKKLTVEQMIEFEKNVEKNVKRLNHESAQFAKQTLEFRNNAIYVNYIADKNEFTSPAEISLEETDNLRYIANQAYEFVKGSITSKDKKYIELIREVNKEIYPSDEN